MKKKCRFLSLFLFESLNFVWRRNLDKKLKIAISVVHGQNKIRVPMLFIEKIMYDFNRDNWFIRLIKLSFVLLRKKKSKFFVFLYDFFGISLSSKWWQFDWSILSFKKTTLELFWINISYLKMYFKRETK